MPLEDYRSFDKLKGTYKRLEDRTATWRVQRLSKPSLSTYKPLKPSSKEIRILEVAPGKGRDIVTCILKHISLLDAGIPAYETISYCWGPLKESSIIKLNGCMVSVPSSSEAAVKRMRYCNRERVLWIDAICIDQSSLSERSQQVAMMSDVYKLAVGNLVYLGDDDVGMAAQAIESVQVLAAEMRQGTDDFTRVWPTVYDVDSGAYLHSDEDFGSPLHVGALEALFNLPWFRRLWILQEVALAPCNTCYWGDMTFDLLSVTRAARWIGFKRDFMSKAMMDCRGWNCASVMFEMSDPSIKSLLEPSYLSDLLTVLQLCEKTEPRDGIFGLLGLLSDKHALPEDWHYLLEVDYVKTVADVMCDATRYALAEAGDMRAIQLSFFPAVEVDAVRNFPSWAVRADLQPEPQALLRLPYFYSADRGLDAPSLFGDMTQGYDVLQSQGFIADRILETTAVCDEDRMLESFYFWLMDVKGRAIRSCSDRYGGSEALITAVAFTLMAGRSKGGQRAQINDIAILTEFLTNLEAPPTDGEEREKVFRAVCEDTWRTLDDITRMLYSADRRFFVTDKGLMGIGPASMETRDFVVVIRGARLPMILRRLLKYRHVGSAYVHGIMNGEAVLEWKARNEAEVIFSIE